MNMNPVRLLKTALLSACVLVCGAAFAANPLLPKTIKIIVPFSAGGSNDLFARAIGRSLAIRNGIVVIIDNRPGAGGAMGAEAVARADPDGATLLLTSVSFSTNASIQPKLPYDPLKSFEPVSVVAKGAMILVVGNTTPYKSTADLIAAAKKPDNMLSYGSAGVGSIGQMATELLNAQAGVNTLHIPYKGINNAVTDMLGGNIQMMITTPASISAQLKARKVRAIAVTSQKRSKFYPELPALSEVVPGYAVEAWWGLLAPAKTPKALIEALNQEIRAITDQPEMRAMFEQEGAEPTTMSPAEFSAYLKEEFVKWKEIVRVRNILPG